MKPTLTHSTDVGPACRLCGSTLRGYAITGEDYGARVHAQCGCCGDVERFTADVDIDHVTIAQLRMAHVRERGAA